MDFNKQSIEAFNKEFEKSTPEEIVTWALSIIGKPVITTNFRPYEAALLHCVSKQQPEIPVIWCDTGYNTEHTYRHAAELATRLNLNLKVYVPKLTKGFRDVIMGIPEVDHPDHLRFTEEVKLEPFRRAMEELKPTIWFTNIRRGQTAVRDRLDILSLSLDGILKVSPFYYWEDERLASYLELHHLPNEYRYYDPTKVQANRECGLHTQ